MISTNYSDSPASIQEDTSDEGHGFRQLLLSVYIVILAFFVVITNQSQMDDNRSQQVLSSMNNQFGRTEWNDSIIGQRFAKGQNQLATSHLAELANLITPLMPENLSPITDEQHLRAYLDETLLFEADNMGEIAIETFKSIIEYSDKEKDFSPSFHLLLPPCMDDASCRNAMLKLHHWAEWMESLSIPTGQLTIGFEEDTPHATLIIQQH